ncbi:MAG TPA: hypothetical protein VJ043_00075 [Candidatus Paceibacterota bacterium]|nr:hypothetical protein [Candidatus Paceibacterota bacterium]
MDTIFKVKRWYGAIGITKDEASGMLRDYEFCHLNFGYKDGEIVRELFGIGGRTRSDVTALKNTYGPKKVERMLKMLEAYRDGVRGTFNG